MNPYNYAPPAMRDQFLAALELSDRQLCAELARHLTTCANPLPGGTCIELGLPMGSCYGAAATLVLERHADAQAMQVRVPALARLVKDEHSPR